MAEVITKLANPAPKMTRDECAVISLDGVSREYAGRTGVVRALDSATFSIVAGEWVAITGPSGSGKSTLVNMLGCLDRPTCGELKIDGTDVASMTAGELDRFRADKIGFIFQQFHLIPYLSALENVMLAQYFHSMTDQEEARAALVKVGLGERAEHLPSELSGGEQQRVCIARALINNPPILLADEPTGNLDHANQKIVAQLLRDLHLAGHTIVMVTHDPEMAALAQRRIALSHGTVFCHPVGGIVRLGK
ncbi:ABC transporter ATP-binding protein [Granulicella tundricola]|uniref:ABC transporter related protein n=1 Tax=Granulicella tundricola (strain ATCC BAA-1859 / DSM 23138 / MP5ACTX9) TaxID=1198114 RepID=E8X3R3_GRATM|nr:ABC transporter ATP-binding protein [Granulicella tundricola]ADW69341.1 ABC transporter related protein [Granulicella tundricola MP5ACTX9]